MADLEIIEKVLSGNREAFADLIRAHHPKVMGLCLSLLSNPAESEDAAQEVFIKAYKALGRFRQEAEFSTWIYRIAYRHCVDLLRKRSRHKTESLEDLIENKGAAFQDLLSAPSPNKLLENRELITQVLDTLSLENKNILISREVYGFTYEEIAAALDATVDSVKGRLKRARKKLEETARHLESLSIVQTSGGQK